MRRARLGTRGHPERVGLPLSKQPHWIKIVYGQHRGEPITASASLDNREDQSLTSAIKALHWPKSRSFYMAKQFILVK